MTNQPNEIWLSWEDSAGYGYWDTRDEAELNSAEDFHPVRFVPAASEAGAVPVAYRYRHSETEKWHYGDTPQSWWECQALTLAAPPSAPAAQPENQAAQTSEVDALRAAQADAVMPLIGPLLDAWEGLPNDLAGEDDLSELKRHVAAINHAMLNAAPPAPSQQAGAVPVGEIVLFGGDLKEVSWRQGKMPEPGTKLYAAPPAPSQQSGADADYPPEIWKEDAPAAQGCPTDVCQAAKRDGVLCANDECDIATGVRAPDAQGDERAAFKAWYVDRYGLKPDKSQGSTIGRWEAWQAGAEWARQQLNKD